MKLEQNIQSRFPTDEPGANERILGQHPIKTTTKDSKQLQIDMIDYSIDSLMQVALTSMVTRPFSSEELQTPECIASTQKEFDKVCDFTSFGMPNEKSKVIEGLKERQIGTKCTRHIIRYDVVK